MTRPQHMLSSVIVFTCKSACTCTTYGRNRICVHCLCRKHTEREKEILQHRTGTLNVQKCSGWRELHNCVEWRGSYKYSYVGLYPLPRGVFDPGTFRMWARRLPQCGVASPGFLASLCATSWRRGTVATDSSILLPFLPYRRLAHLYVMHHTNEYGTMPLAFQPSVTETAQKPRSLLNSGMWDKYGQHKHIRSLISRALILQHRYLPNNTAYLFCKRRVHCNRRRLLLFPHPSQVFQQNCWATEVSRLWMINSRWNWFLKSRWCDCV
jgi:hypothetical protein